MKHKKAVIGYITPELASRDNKRLSSDCIEWSLI
jgi:hypothetical protein